MRVLAILALIGGAAAFAPAPSASSRSVSLNAETAEWSAPAEWKEKDFESQIKKLEKEAEERLDTKIDELKRNIASTGKSD
eukprot:CAMPEP_0185801274 /NCGR_PEP_ID=MMETSP1322-20130828/1345_1 /TAXON_ID=265543 /ORGANISM="Minutocellus polymorphus, Strain RCC2270" /LENGTH=80 /DNA_ID=CAMNT_0028496963 /DNA_START=59 /DNA_END=301 /DNA_ORIENTATION=-